MSVTLQSSTGNIISEYAASQIIFTRNMIPDANGHLTGAFSGQVNYNRQDYLVDAHGNRLATVGRPANTQLDAKGQDPYAGFIHLGPADLAPYLTVATNETHFGYIANLADSLIKADLVARGIMAAGS